MRFRVLCPDVLAGQVRVDLRRRDARVPQQLLHVPQRRASPQQMRREAVTNHMRRDALANARLLGPPLQDEPEALPAQSPPTAVEKQAAPDCAFANAGLPRAI